MWQPILMIDGYLMSILGISMLIPAAYEICLHRVYHSPFLFAAAVSLFLGVMLFLANRMPIKKITIRQGYLITVSGWLCLTILAAMPFIFSGVVDNFTDAWFESVSGLTAVGGTILTDVEKVAKPVLLWRSMLNGLGGVGIVIFAVALLPYLGIGGMQIFQRENSDSDDKFMPKFNYIAKRIIAVYLLLLLGCIISYNLSGMSWFDAVNHGLTTISTGGFSTKNNSLAAFNNVRLEMVAILFMLSGSLPMTYYIALLQKQGIHNLRSQQVMAFFKILLLYIAFVSLWLIINNGMSLPEALRYASFNVVSMVTTTGYYSTNYLSWGGWATTAFLIFAFTGGCTGSTTGSVKIFRWQVFYAFLKKSLISAAEPNRVMPVKVGIYTIEGSLVSSVFVFFGAYLMCMVIFTALLALTGLDFTTAFCTASAAMTNTGLGAAEANGPLGNYAFLSTFAKQICCVAMLIGRLDVLTVLVLLTRNFWHN